MKIFLTATTAALALLSATALPAAAQQNPYSFSPGVGWYSTPGYSYDSPSSSYSLPTPATSLPAPDYSYNPYGSGGYSNSVGPSYYDRRY